MGHLLLGRRARGPRTRVYPRGHFFFGHHAHYEKQMSLPICCNVMSLLPKHRSMICKNQMHWMKPSGVKLEALRYWHGLIVQWWMTDKTGRVEQNCFYCHCKKKNKNKKKKLKTRVVFFTSVIMVYYRAFNSCITAWFVQYWSWKRGNGLLITVWMRWHFSSNYPPPPTLTPAPHTLIPPSMKYLMVGLEK